MVPPVARYPMEPLITLLSLAALGAAAVEIHRRGWIAGGWIDRGWIDRSGIDRWALPWGQPPPPPEPPPLEPWEGEVVVREVLTTTRELGRLVERLGFDPKLEDAVERRLTDLRALVRVEIPDFEAFEVALDKVAAREDGASEETRLRYRTENDPLLHEVLAVRHDPTQVLAILSRNPVGELLPFVEQIPIERGGRVSWRSPMEVSLIHKVPADRRRFVDILDTLGPLLRDARLKRPEPLRQDALDALSRLRRDLARDRAYLPTPLRTFEERVHEWLDGAPAGALDKRKALRAFVDGLLEVRHSFRITDPPPVLGDEDLDRFGRAVRQQAQTYTDAPWMHTPWLTDRLLSNLVAAELGPHPEADRTRNDSPAGMLLRVWREVDSGYYDPKETRHRLRRLEEQGLFVHSLVHALLRLRDD